MTTDSQIFAAQSRQERMLRKIGERCTSEAAATKDELSARDDYFPALRYFVEAATAGTDPATVAARVGKPVAALMCLQAPLEIFHAFGLHPLRIFSGSHMAARVSAPHVSTLMCPMLRSALGALQFQSRSDDGRAPDNVVDKDVAAWIVPTTCDWVVRFPEMMENCGYSRSRHLHYLELPHLKDGQQSQSRWLAEIYALRDFLSVVTGKKLRQSYLHHAVEVYHDAWRAFVRLTDLRRKVKMSGLWYLLICNAFFLCDVEEWTQAVVRALPGFNLSLGQNPGVMLAGSPIFFPNFKILHLIEQAGLNLLADDLCSGERLFPGGVFVNDRSEYGLLQALAQRYHQGCRCPTFAENDRRLAHILHPHQKDGLKGVVFHVLKGCHPFDIASFTLERCIRDNPLKYIKLETDYTTEDSRTLLTRLEAFRSTLEG